MVVKRKKYMYVCKECLGIRCNKNFPKEQDSIKCPEGKNSAWTLIAVIPDETPSAK